MLPEKKETAETAANGEVTNGYFPLNGRRSISANSLFPSTGLNGTELTNGTPVKLSRAYSNEWECLQASEHSIHTINPIRKIVDFMNVSPNPKKELLKLHLGDPTLTGVLPTDSAIVQAIQNTLESGRYNGYGPAVGLAEARGAVAEFFTSPQAPITPDDVIMTSGCSHALQLAIEALANPGDNILVPRPGFPLYTTLMRPHKIEDRHYDLLMDRNWEADLDQLESMIDNRTKGIIVNNPSNPCGAVYSKEHLRQILNLAEKCKVPIIADEIYGDLVFDGAKFYPMAQLEPKVPILTCDGLSKRYLVPGWRLGWLIIHDRFGALSQVREGARQLTTKIVGPCTLIQAALSEILHNTPDRFFHKTRTVLSENARAAMEELHDVPGLKAVKPQGAMYMMVGISTQNFPNFTTELEFTKALIGEESVYCLPGTTFSYPGTFRLVLTYEPQMTREACRRIKEFCARHYRNSKKMPVSMGRSQGEK